MGCTNTVGSARTVTLDTAKQLARQALDAGNHAEAQAIANKILSAAPMDPAAYLLVAQADLSVGRFAVARPLVNRALALAPGFEPARNLNNQLDKIAARFATDEYQSSYLVLRSRHLEYPRNIQLETSGRCNAKCTFCPHEQLDRKSQVMSDALYEKIIREASAIPAGSAVKFILNVVNEPFMDQKIFERIALLNREIPHATIGIYTNLNVMPPRFFEKLKEVRRLTYFNISFNAANKAEYEETMRIDFNRTVSNIRKLLTENRTQGYFASPVALSRISSLDERDARFVEECTQVFSGFEYGRDFILECKSRANWLGQNSSSQTSIPFLEPCNQWLNISVLCNGIVPHCCMDARGDFPFGNANEQSILEIYNSPRFRNYRRTVAARETTYPCNTCALV